MNVLITSAGRRNYLVRYFQKAVGPLGQVFVADMDSTAPALQEGADRVVLPAARDPEFIRILTSECVRLQIGLVVPLNDLELQAMAGCREKLEALGVRVVVANLAEVETCLDKWRTAQFLESNGIPSPRTFCSLKEVEVLLDSDELSFPLVIKPRWGSGSIGVEVVADVHELRAAYELVVRKLGRTILHTFSQGERGPTVLLQEFLPGQEFGLDVVNNLEGQYFGTIVRRKIGMRAGETDRAEIIGSPLLEELGERLGKLLRHRGNLDVDVMVGEQGPSVIEMNPRFGGGYPFSHEAGADIPRALVLWAAGRTPGEELVRARVGWRGAKYELARELDC